jgi:hypothetical protein
MEQGPGRDSAGAIRNSLAHAHDAEARRIDPTLLKLGEQIGPSISDMIFLRKRGCHAPSDRGHKCGAAFNVAQRLMLNADFPSEHAG